MLVEDRRVIPRNECARANLFQFPLPSPREGVETGRIDQDLSESMSKIRDQLEVLVESLSHVS